MAKRDSGTSGVLVIGLGRFGSAVAASLDSLDREVLAVEKSPRIVTQWQSRLPVVQADATSAEALEQLGRLIFKPQWWGRNRLGSIGAYHR